MKMIPSEFYNKGLSDRQPYEKRAEDISAISLPYVMRKDGSDGNTSVDYFPSQSFNGSIINNLKAKMGLALLPPSTSSFRLMPDQEQMRQLFGDGSQNEQLREKLTSELSVKTESINKEIENQQIRASLFDMITQLIINGSVVVEKIPKDGILIYPLKSFVVDLDSRGKPLAICVKEVTSVLPDNVSPKEVKDEYELFTLLYLDKDTNKWIMVQDIDGEIVGDERTFKDYDALPFKYFGWTWMQGEDYHRGFAEDYYSDMRQVDKLAKLNTEGAIISAKSLVLVNPRGGRTRKQDVTNSANGGVIDGSADDITSFQFNKNYDFQVSNEREAEIKRNLMKAFLDSGSATRDAERVTAEEIRLMSQQLEASSLAGVYSKLSKSWSKWIVMKIMDELKIKFEAIDVQVLTGLDSIGRSQEAQKQDSFVQRAASLNMLHWINERELLQRYASYDSINTVNLLKTTQQVQQEMQQAQQRQAQQQLLDSGAQSVGQQAGQALQQPQ